MALSRKHYVAVAEILREKSKRERAIIDNYDNDFTYRVIEVHVPYPITEPHFSQLDAATAYVKAEVRRDLINEIGDEFIKLFKADNTNFNTEIFRKAAALRGYK